MRTRLVLILGCLLLAVSAAGVLSAQDETSGSVVLGWRFVDVDGAEGKYRQHINLDEGARVFAIDFDYRPSGSDPFADVVELDVDSLGGEPYESIDFKVRKFGEYSFQLGRRKSDYFYEDVLLPPELVNPRLSNGGDFHHFDFERVRDFATLDLTLSPKAKLDVSLDRFSKSGENTTVYDVSRDEFELDQPIDESMDQLAVGFQYSWDKATLVLRETYREYQNTQEVFLPGQSEGENPGPAILDFYFLDQPVDLKSNQHRAQLNARPHDDVIIKVGATLESLDLDFSAHERAQGIAFNGAPLAEDTTGGGDVGRDLELFDVEVSWLLTGRLALVGGLRQYSLDQEGVVLFGSEDADRAWDLETTTIDLGLEFAATTELTLAVGVLEESRDVDERVETDLHSVSTDHTGVFARVDWQPNKQLDVRASFENSSYDDPYTLASPTDRDRLSLNLRYQNDSGFYAQGHLLSQDVENDNSLWNADYESLNLRGGYRRSDLDVSLGYSFIEVERSIDQVLTTFGFGGGQMVDFPILFLSEADFIDARVAWRANERVRVGADLRFFENSGNFGNEREDLRVFGEIGLSDNYLLHLAVRTLDYSEDRFGLNDYEAEIFELGVGYRF